MWHSIKRWLGWAMSNVISIARHRPRGLSIYVRYEKAGLTLYDTPVPWNADAVVVEVLVLIPPSARRKADFVLRFPGSPAIAAEALRPEADDRYRLLFRIPTPCVALAGELLHRNRLLATVNIPILPSGDFFGGLKLNLPTVGVRLGSEIVAAQTFVASQCRGL